MTKTPVLFMFFNRPDTTKKVFEEIKKAKPKKLFLASDGPRNDNEKKTVQDLRKYVLDNVNWDCDVKTLFREKNLGCKLACSGAVRWFFDNVEQGMVIEDDCLPNQSFFRYCEAMLERYKDDERIMMVTGSNFLLNIDIPESYLFSQHFAFWGWASWRRAWDKYDIEMKDWHLLKKKKYLYYIFKDWLTAKYYEINFDLMKEEKIDTWDYQWVYSCLFNNGLCIAPKVNLISNIGVTGVHTPKKSNLNFLKTYTLPRKLIHPKHIFVNKDYDEVLYGGRRAFMFKLVIFNILRKTLRRLGLFDLVWGTYKKLRR